MSTTSKNIRLMSLGARAQMEFNMKPEGFHIMLFHPNTANLGSVWMGNPQRRIPLQRCVHLESYEPWTIYMGYDKESNTLCVAEPEWW